MKKILLPLFLFSLTLPALLWAGLEPPLETLMPIYILKDLQGAGKVEILKDGSTVWQKAREGQVLEEGDRLKTGEDTEATLGNQQTFLRVGEDTEIKVDRLADEGDNGIFGRISLAQGELLSDGSKNPSKDPSTFEVKTSGGLFLANNSMFLLEVSKDQSLIYIQKGSLQVHFSEEPQMAEEGQAYFVTPTGLQNLGISQEEVKSQFDSWTETRHRIAHHLRGKPLVIKTPKDFPWAPSGSENPADGVQSAASPNGTLGASPAVHTTYPAPSGQTGSGNLYHVEIQ